MALEWLIPAGLSLLTSGIGGTKTPPKFGMSGADIDKLLSKYRRSGQEGLRALETRSKEDATARLAASGFSPTLGIQQALFNPMLQRLGTSRSELEGKLANVEGNLMMGLAQGQQSSDLAGYQNLTNLFGGAGDLFGLLALQGLQGGFGGQQSPQSAGTAYDPFKSMFGSYATQTNQPINRGAQFQNTAFSQNSPYANQRF